MFYNLREGPLQIMIKWACYGTFYISFTNHRRIIKASGRVVTVVMVLHQAACFIDAWGSGGRKKNLVLCFMSYFSSSPSSRASLVVPRISDHQSWLYYYFSTKCFDFQPTQEIKSPPFSQCWNPLFPHLFIHSSFFSSSSLSLKFFLFFFRACFKMSSSALVSSHPSHPSFRPHPEAPREACFCIVSVLAATVPVFSALWHRKQRGQRSALKRHTSHPRTRFSCAGKRRRVHTWTTVQFWGAPMWAYFISSSEMKINGSCWRIKVNLITHHQCFCPA